MASPDVYRARFLREVGQLRAQFPADGALIGSFEAVADGDDHVVFGLLIGLVGPSAPVCADALWECVSGFLRDLRRMELFSEPMQLRRPVPGAIRGTRRHLYVRRFEETRKIQASSRPSSAANTRRPSSRAIAHRSTGAQSRPRSELSMTVSA